MVESPFRVGLDVSAVPVNPAGAGRYVLELAKGLGERTDTDLTVIARTDDEKRWLSLLDEGTVVSKVPTSRPIRLLYEQTRLGRLINAQDLRVFHSPHYTMPRGVQIPQVVTIHDMTLFDHPEVHERSKVLYFQRAIKQAAEKADALVCVSNRTADRFTARFNPRGKVVVIEHGVDHGTFYADDDVHTVESDKKLLSQQNLERPFLLFVGTLEPRKNLQILIEAFGKIADQYPEHELVLAGQRGWHFEDLAEALKASPVRERIRILGYVADELVPALLRRCAATVYPSKDEGFGLPVLEALACGAPVITTSGSAHSDLAADAALMVMPGEASELADSISQILGEDPQREVRREKGLQLAAQFQWSTSVQAHRDLYASLS